MTFIQSIIGWDFFLYRLISRTLYHPLPFWFFQLITNLFDLSIFLLFCYLLYIALVKRQITDTQKTLWSVLILVFVTALITIFLKMLIRRVGPTPFIQPWPELRLFPKTFSFPSGHSSRAFALATALAIKFPRWKTLLIIGAILVGFSRIYIGVHYPADVFAGAILGASISWIFLRLKQRNF